MDKKIIFSYLSAASFLLLLSSCDNIKEPDRYIPVEKPTVSKKLLIQEFTGNRCTNCPKGAAAIHNIQEQYPGQVIVVGLHPEGGGPNTRPIGDQDFRCEEAQVMYEYYKPGGFPCAVFDGDISTISTSYSTWSSTAYEIFRDWNENDISSGMNIDATTVFNESTREVTVNYDIEILRSFTTSMSIMVWIMENDIIGYQLDGDEYVPDYVHNHVLRASLNGPWGQELPQLQLTEGSVIEGTASIKVDESWVAENCQIVIYTFQTDNRIVEQAMVENVVE